MADLQIESVRHSFNGVNILKTDYTPIKAGLVTGIIGINGCGKSTLFKILFGTLKADYSRIVYDGQHRTNLFTVPGLISILPQENFLPKYLTVNQFLKIAKLPKEKEKLMREQYDPLLTQKIRTLSGGERRMLEIQYILSLETKYKILDEPFIGLEPKAIELTKNLIRNNDCGIIISSHLYRDLADELDETYLLSNGKLVKVESEEELRANGYLPKESKESKSSPLIY